MHPIFKSLPLALVVPFALSGCVVSESSGTTDSLPPSRCDRAWVFFDLGNTLVDTDTHKFEKILYMPGAEAYLKTLRDHDFPMGMIINVPEKWGKTEAQRVDMTKSVLNEKWVEPSPFPWDWFEVGIQVPPSDKERKPAPIIFARAKALARAAGCPAVFQGEVEEELDAARSLGFVVHKVGDGEKDRFLPVSLLLNLTAPQQSQKKSL